MATKKRAPTTAQAMRQFTRAMDRNSKVIDAIGETLRSLVGVLGGPVEEPMAELPEDPGIQRKKRKK